MICEHCGKNPATVHYTKIVNGEKSEYHLCEQCAREKGELNLGLTFQPGFSIQNLLGSIFGGSVEAEVPSETCPKCGATYEEFSRTGRLGCPDCYKAFSSRLNPLIRRVQGSVKHNGKAPERAGAGIKAERKISELEKSLQKAIAEERYEDAARIRDELRSLKQA